MGWAWLILTFTYYKPEMYYIVFSVVSCTFLWKLIDFIEGMGRCVQHWGSQLCEIKNRKQITVRAPSYNWLLQTTFICFIDLICCRDKLVLSTVCEELLDTCCKKTVEKWVIVSVIIAAEASLRVPRGVSHSLLWHFNPLDTKQKQDLLFSSNPGTLKGFLNAGGGLSYL